jgi:hypothetical protein
VSQTRLAFTEVLVELRTVVVHSLVSANLSLSFSKSSFVTQCFSVTVFERVADLAFILSSILARCSGVSRFNISGGIPISPALCMVRVLSQRPGLIFSGCSLAAGCTSVDGRISFVDFWVCPQQTGSAQLLAAMMLATTTIRLRENFILASVRLGADVAHHPE